MFIKLEGEQSECLEELETLLDSLIMDGYQVQKQTEKGINLVRASDGKRVKIRFGDGEEW